MALMFYLQVTRSTWLAVTTLRVRARPSRVFSSSTLVVSSGVTRSRCRQLATTVTSTVVCWVCPWAIGILRPSNMVTVNGLCGDCVTSIMCAMTSLMCAVTSLMCALFELVWWCDVELWRHYLMCVPSDIISLCDAAGVWCNILWCDVTNVHDARISRR